jgi:hypothetical protein
MVQALALLFRLSTHPSTHLQLSCCHQCCWCLTQCQTRPDDVLQEYRMSI